jgi:hypothetical protein
VLAAIGVGLVAAVAPLLPDPLAWSPLLFAAVSLQAFGLMAAAVRLRRRPFGPGAERRPWHLLVATAAVAAAAWLVPCLLASSPARAPLWLAAGLPIVLAAALVRASGPLLVVAAGLIALFVWPLPERPAPHGRWLSPAGAQRALYRPADQTILLLEGEREVAAVGPERHDGALAAVLVHAFASAGDRVLVLGPGQGPVRAAIERLPQLVVDAAERRPHPASAWLQAIGPVPPIAPAPPLPTRAVGFGPLLRALPAGSRQVVVVAEPVPCESAMALAEFARELARVAGDGFVLQQCRCDGDRGDALAALFASAVATWPWNGVFRVGDTALMVSAAAPLAFDRVAPLASWPAPLRWLAHATHVGEADDLRRIWLGVLRSAPLALAATGGNAGAVGSTSVIQALHRWLEPAPEPPLANASLFCHWRRQMAERRLAHQQLTTLPATAAGRAEALQLAVRFLPHGAPSAPLQAALGLAPDLGLAPVDGYSASDTASPVVAAHVASRRAHAIDPTFWCAAPPVFAGMPVPTEARGELEDLGQLPPPPRLVELASSATPLAIALRARFPSACAEALVAALGAAPLAPPAMAALRELADPFVLTEAAAVLRDRGGERELLALWRFDLALPPALAALVRGTTDDRLALAKALVGRRDASCVPALADLLVDDELAVRRTAAAALAQLPAHDVAYDPTAVESARQAAAQRLRALHNRAP